MNHNGEGTSIGKSGLSGQKTEQMITYVLEKQTNKQTGWAPSMGLSAESWTKMFDFIKVWQNSVKKMK